MERKGVIHARARRDFSPGPLKEPGRPEGQNLGAHVTSCGELPSFGLLIRDGAFLPLEKPGVIHSPGAHLLLLGVGGRRQLYPADQLGGNRPENALEYLYPAYGGGRLLPHGKIRPGHATGLSPQTGQNLGHILVSFLAVTMWRTLQQWMKASGLGTAPRKLLEELRELRSLDVLLPRRDKTFRLRMVATPSRELKVLLQRIKVLIPNRPKMIENVVEKMA